MSWSRSPGGRRAAGRRGPAVHTPRTNTDKPPAGTDGEARRRVRGPGSLRPRGRCPRLPAGVAVRGSGGPPRSDSARMRMRMRMRPGLLSGPRHRRTEPAALRPPGCRGCACARRKPPLGWGAPGLASRAASGGRRGRALPDPRWASGFHPTPRLRRSGCVPDRPGFPPFFPPAGPAPEPGAPRPRRACSTPCAGRPYRSWGRLGHGSALSGPGRSRCCRRRTDPQRRQPLGLPSAPRLARPWGPAARGRGDAAGAGPAGGAR